MSLTVKPLPLYQHTVYFSLPMQMYMNTMIKAPALESVHILFSNEPRWRKLKAAKTLWEVFQSLKALPKPTVENTWHPNTHNLIIIRDWLLGCLNLNKQRQSLIERLLNFAIVLYDFDPPWRWIMDSAKDKAMSMEWEPRGYDDEWTNDYRQWWNENSLT